MDDDDEEKIYDEYINGRIDYTDAVIRLTAVLDDVEKAQAMVNEWQHDLNHNQPDP